MFKKIIFLSIVVCLSGCNAPNNLTILSPDNTISVTVVLDDTGTPHYSIKKAGEIVLLSSGLGVKLENSDLSKGMVLTKIGALSTVAEDYTLSHGKRKVNHYAANQRIFYLQNKKGDKLNITFRVSNDGVAFQYTFPCAPSDIKVVKAELTTFVFELTTKAWLQKVAVAQTGWKNTNPSYEEHYEMDIPVGTESSSPAGWVFPALFNTGTHWVLISEAGMDGDFHASRLQPKSPNGVYSIGYPMAPEVYTNGVLMAQSSLPFKSPWRIVLVGDLETVVESSLGTDLAEPAIDVDASEFKPGIAAWSWALLKDPSVNYETQVEFIDYAADMGWPYTLVDADWDRNIGYDRIKKLANYAASKNVKLILWYNSSGAWNETTYSPKSALLTREQRRSEFAKLQEMGIKGVKIDFFAGDGKSMMAYYNDVAQDAADFGLMVNYHGSSLPRGLHRTYPNLMTMEAVHGFEMITFMQPSADVAASHMAMLPFARNAFDPMDFTPTSFGEIPGIKRQTTNGFEIALPIVFLSGIQHIAETADGMKKVPTFVRDFMKDLHVSWDETQFISGYPGKDFVVARRHGNSWYVGGINGQNIAKSYQLDLSFIDNAEGTLITDGKNPFDFVQSAITSSSAVSVSVKPYGGFVMVFKK